MSAETKEEPACAEQEVAASPGKTLSLEDVSKENDKTDAENEGQFMSGVKLQLLTFGLSLACFLMALDMSILNTAIPEITERFHSTADIGWYVSAYLLAVCSLQPLSGKLYTNFSLKVKQYVER